MGVLPELPVGRGEVEGGEDLPVVLLDGGFQGGGQIAKAIRGAGVRWEGEANAARRSMGEVCEVHVRPEVKMVFRRQPCR